MIIGLNGPEAEMGSREAVLHPEILYSYVKYEGEAADRI
jgi:hypothetical protein